MAEEIAEAVGNVITWKKYQMVPGLL